MSAPRIGSRSPRSQARFSSLLVERDYYLRQSAWLLLINQLHTRLAGAVDQTGILEAFSVWLSPLVDHELLAISDPGRGRLQSHCSSHGPDRRRLRRAINDLAPLPENPGIECFRLDSEIRVCRTSLELDANRRCRLFVLRRENDFQPEEERLLDEAVRILIDPLNRSRHYEDLFELARRDSLTGLANRRVFEEQLLPMLDAARRYQQPLTIASLDLDRFKEVNDAYGHARGDQVLKRAAEMINATIRTSDLLVRIGGDEFLLLLPHTTLEGAQCLAARLCQKIDDLGITLPGGARMSVSIGLAPWQPGQEKDEWLQLADEALYRAKAEGGARCCH